MKKTLTEKIGIFTILNLAVLIINYLILVYSLKTTNNNNNPEEFIINIVSINIVMCSCIFFILLNRKVLFENYKTKE